MMNKNEQIKLWFDEIMIMFIAILLIFGIIKTLFLPDKINEYEKRTANTLKDINSINDFLNTKAQNKIELTFADQIPCSILMKKVYNHINSKIKYYYLSETEKKIENFDKLIMGHPDIDFAMYYIEKDSDIDFVTNECLNISDFIEEKIHRDNLKTDSFKIRSFEEYKKYFYKTDLHWNYLGSYKGYCEILKMVAPNEEPIKPKQIVKVNEPFTGIKSEYIGAGAIYNEEFKAYYFDLPQHDTYMSGKKQEYGEEKEYLENPNRNVEYGSYYGPDSGEVIIDFNRPEKENILILGDSFDNAIIKILASHFNKTYSVDLRHYKREMGEEFKFGEYVKKNNITKVIFCGNIGFYISNKFFVEE